MSTTIDEFLRLVEGNEDTEKTAAAAPAPSAKDQLTNLLSTGDTTGMDKEALYNVGVSLGQELLKSANEIINENIRDTGTQSAQVLPTPDGSVDNILRALVARAKDSGAQDQNPDMEALLGQAAEGNADGRVSEALRLALLGGGDETGQPAAGKTLVVADEEEKTAALNALVDAGIDYDSAVDLVKSAAEAIEEEEGSIVKAAALNELVSNGLSFEQAAELVKMATETEDDTEVTGTNVALEKKAALNELISAGYSFEDAADLIKAAVTIDAPHWKEVAEDRDKEVSKIKGFLTKAKDVSIRNVKAVGKHVAAHKGKYGAGAGALAAAGGAGAYLHHKKAEALNELVGAGYSFEDAANLIKSADAVTDVLGKVKDKAAKAGLAAKSGAKTVSELVKNHPRAAVAGVAGAATLGAGAALMHKHREKQAALNALVEGGVSFEDAINLINAAG